MARYIAKVIAVGVPALLILLGFIAFMGGNLSEMIFGTSGDMIGLGLAMIIVGLIIYVVEIFVSKL